MTGDDNFIGVIYGDDEGDRWYPKPNHQYKETALLIDLAAEDVKPEILAPAPLVAGSPNGEAPVEPSVPVTSSLCVTEGWEEVNNWLDRGIMYQLCRTTKIVG